MLSIIDVYVLQLGSEEVDSDFLDVKDRQNLVQSGLAWLLSAATPEPVSRVNSARSCYMLCVGVLSKVPTLSWRHLALSATTQDDFSVSSWLFFSLLNIIFLLMIIVSCASASCDESEHLFSGCRLQEYPANAYVQSVRRGDPEGVITVSSFMVLVFPLTGECNSCPTVVWKQTQVAIVVHAVYL